jgi:hypothetical protein
MKPKAEPGPVSGFGSHKAERGSGMARGTTKENS